MKPVIGLSALYTEAAGMKFYKTNSTYVHAILRAGGVPVLIPATISAEDCEMYANTLDGLLVPGGADVCPDLYGEEPIAKVSETHRVDDLFEEELIRKVAEQNKPILGICRGNQIINVTFGGNLYQDIITQYSDAQCHCQTGRSRNEPFHHVYLKEGSRVAKIFGDVDLLTNTFHHQAVKDPAPGFKIVGQAKDGIVEAIEHDSKFIVGIQWHPEGLAEDYPQFQKIFDALVEAAKEHKENK